MGVNPGRAIAHVGLPTDTSNTDTARKIDSTSCISSTWRNEQMFKKPHGWLVIYLAVLGDYLTALRNSLFIALFLTCWYGAAILLGLHLGLALYDTLAPIIDLMTLRLPVLASIIIDLVTLVLLVTATVALYLFLARFLIYGLVILFERSAIDEVYYLSLAIALTFVIVAFVLAAFVSQTSGQGVVTIGFFIIAALSLLVIAAWLHFRYRIELFYRHWTGPARVFRHDLGAAVVRLGRLS